MVGSLVGCLDGWLVIDYTKPRFCSLIMLPVWLLSSHVPCPLLRILETSVWSSHELRKWKEVETQKIKSSAGINFCF